MLWSDPDLGLGKVVRFGSGYGCLVRCESGSGYCDHIWIWIRIMWSEPDLDAGIVVRFGSGSRYCGPIRIRVRVLWSDPDLDPGIVVRTGSISQSKSLKNI